jgi:tRNA(fMet)-specific endonuclease VapC
VGLILDASVFIEAERELFDLDGLLESGGDEPVAIAAVTASELLHGVERATDQSVRAKRHQYVERLLNDFPIIPFGLDEAREHARIWAALAGKGTPIGAHDLLVAATALANGAAVATLNQKEFKRVPGVSLVPIARYVRSKRT